MGGNDAKRDPLEPCRFGEFRFRYSENRTELDCLLAIFAGRFEQPESLDELIQFVAQFARGAIEPRELYLLGAPVEGFREDVVRSHDNLQGLAQIMTGNRQQRGAKVVVAIPSSVAVGEADSRNGESGVRLGERAGCGTDRFHPTLVLWLSEAR